MQTKQRYFQTHMQMKIWSRKHVGIIDVNKFSEFEPMFDAFHYNLWFKNRIRIMRVNKFLVHEVHL